MSHYAAKIDQNQPIIIEALEAAGAKVLNLSRLGGGVPDLLVTVGQRFSFAEVKYGREQLLPAQEDFAKDWPVRVLRTPEDAIALVTALKARA